jgi:hypothetical protein
MPSKSVDALRMARKRKHASGDHRMCTPSMCMLTYSELLAVRALLAELRPTEPVRFTSDERGGG